MYSKLQGRRWHAGVVFLFALLVGCGGAPETKPIAERQSRVKPKESGDRDDSAVEKPAEPSPPPQPTEPQISADAFRMAAYEGRTETVRKALESGADVNAADPSKSLTALHMAAYNGHSKIVELLLEHDATIDCRDTEGKTPLTHACTGPFAETVEILVKAGADINAKESTESFTPLMMAAGLGQTDVVKVLLRHDADKSVVDDDQESAIDHARNGGHAEIVKLLQ